MLSSSTTLALLLSLGASISSASAKPYPGPRRLDVPQPVARDFPSLTSTSNSPRALGRRTAGVPVTPSDWPTTTQAAATPSITKASSADPYLNSLSYALNNNGNSLWTTQYTGDLTYYNTGSVACGDVYADTTYTAAISHLMYDSWPGVTANTNRNPVCGPWVPGRNVMDANGNWVTAVASSDGVVDIGGDGLPNCHSGSKCHIPMTATVTNPATGLSVVVSIVDRCGGCAMGDIDLTPTAYAAIADPNAGRVPGIQWHFNVMGGVSTGPTTSSTTKASTSTTSTKATTSTTSIVSTTSTKATTSTSTSTTTTSKATSTTSSTSSKATTSTVASGGACSGIAAWSSSVAYNGGAQVTYGGYLWTAAYWTEASVPGGPAGVWVQGAAC